MPDSGQIQRFQALTPVDLSIYHTKELKYAKIPVKTTRNRESWQFSPCRAFQTLICPRRELPNHSAWKTILL